MRHSFFIRFWPLRPTSSLRWGVLLGLCLGLSSLHAQFNQNFNNLGQQPNYGQGQGFDPQNQSPFDTDSLGTDSAQQKIDIPPETRWVDRQRLFLHQDDFMPLISRDLSRIHLWDPMDALPGFTRSLGQLGKPYQTFYSGFSEDLFARDLWRHPVFGTYNRFMLSAAQHVPYYDTRTPYVNVNFAQGTNELTKIEATISRNVTPNWNFTFLYRRRQAVGVYRNFVTDHTSLTLSQYFRTPNRRYHLFGNATFNELSDQLHGGVPRPESDQYPVLDGIISDVDALYDASFFKATRSPILGGAAWKHVNKALYLDHYYHLIGPPDSADAVNRLTLRNEISYDNTYSRVLDPSIDTSALGRNLVPVYPTLDTVRRLSENVRARSLRIKGLVSYSFAPAERLQLNLNGGLVYERIAYTKDSVTLVQNQTDQVANGILTLPLGTIEAQLRQRFSDLYGPERTLGAQAEFQLAPRQARYDLRQAADSMDYVRAERKPPGKQQKSAPLDQYIPLKLRAEYDFRDLNPTFFQVYYQGSGGNAYAPNPNLENQNLLHLRGELRYEPQAPVFKLDTLLPTFYSVSVFASRAGRFHYFDREMNPRQAAEGEGLSWLGAEARFRLRFFKHFFWENLLIWQRGTTSGPVDLQRYAAGLPEFSGKSSLYFDHRALKIADELRVGLDVYFNSPFVGHTLDVASTQFFPTDYQVRGYARIDALFALRIQPVYLFFKFVHVNEGLLLGSGYYTTPFYPMLERTFTLGVNWNFFD